MLSKSIFLKQFTQVQRVLHRVVPALAFEADHRMEGVSQQCDTAFRNNGWEEISDRDVHFYSLGLSRF